MWYAFATIASLYPTLLFNTRTQANLVSKAECLKSKSRGFVGLQCNLYLTLLASGNEFGTGAV